MTGGDPLSDDCSDDTDGSDAVDDGDVDDGEPGTELDLYDPDMVDAEPGTDLALPTYELDTVGPTVTILDVEDLDDAIDAEIEQDIEGALDPFPQVPDLPDRPGGKGIGGGKGKKERKLPGGGGGGFTLFGITLNVSPKLNIGSGNTASVFGGRAQRQAQASRLTRGGRTGSTGGMQRRIVRSRWLDKALGGGR